MFRVYMCEEVEEEALIPMTKLYEGTRDQCWDFIAKRIGPMQVLFSEYVVEKPAISIGAHGYPTRWDEAPARYQRM